MRRTILIVIALILPIRLSSCNGPPTPPMPPYTPMPTPHSWHQVWPTCTPFPEPEGLARAVQDACWLANGEPIVIDREGAFWRVARDMGEARPEAPVVRVVYEDKVYWAQWFDSCFLFHPDGRPEEMYYMTNRGREIHAVIPCVRMDTTPIVE